MNTVDMPNHNYIGITIYPVLKIINEFLLFKY